MLQHRSNPAGRSVSTGSWRPLGLLLVASVVFQVSPMSLGAQAQPQPLRPLAPIPPSGLWVSPSMEGWYANDDGTYTISFGYNNRNDGDIVEIPLGPDNFIVPAEFDGMQPTVFQSGHVRGAFGVTIPAEMRDQDVVWTLRNEGRTLTVPGRARSSAYQLDWRPRPQGSLPPILRFEEDGPEGQGPEGLRASTPVEARAGTPVELSAWVTDPSERDPDDFRAQNVPVTLGWYLFQGEGEIVFEGSGAVSPRGEDADSGRVDVRDPDEDEVQGDLESHQVEVASGEGWGTIRATFMDPGTYLLRVQAENFRAIDSAESQQCCWTNGYLQVVVSP